MNELLASVKRAARFRRPLFSLLYSNLELPEEEVVVAVVVLEVV